MASHDSLAHTPIRYQQLGPIIGLKGLAPGITTKGVRGVPTVQEKDAGRRADRDGTCLDGLCSNPAKTAKAGAAGTVSFTRQGTITRIDGSSAILGKCDQNTWCWEVDTPVFRAAAKSNAVEPASMSKPYEADLYSNLSVLVGEDWRYGSAMEPALALINDPLPSPLLSSLVSLSPTPLPGNNASNMNTGGKTPSRTPLPDSTNVYWEAGRRPLRYSVQDGGFVTDPSGSLALRRFSVNMSSRDAFWKSKRDTQLRSAGIKCAVDVSETSLVPLLVGKPHLLDCDSKDLQGSPAYTVPTWDLASFDPGPLDTFIDYEPHSGAASCSNERFSSYVVVDPSLMKVRVPF